MVRTVRSVMDDRSLLQTVLIVAVLSLAVNAYTLYEVKGRAEAQEAPPANLFGELICPRTCKSQCEGKVDYTQCYDECKCKCNGPGAACSYGCKKWSVAEKRAVTDVQCVLECQTRVC